MKFRWAGGLLALIVVLSAGLEGARAQQSVTGVASFRERIALPPGSVFEAVLENVGRADVPAIEIGRVVLDDPGNPPIRFSIGYDRAAIRDADVYAVRTRVVLGDQLLFGSDDIHPVITRGAPVAIEVPMRMVNAPLAQTPAAAEPIEALGLRLPASFAGDLPCEDCEAVRYRLNLWPDQVFNMRRRWEGTDRTQDAIGRWSVDNDRRTLLLWDGEDRIEFQAEPPDRLRLVGKGAASAAPDARYELTGTPGIVPIDLRLSIRGTVSFVADKARLTECLTGRNYPLAEEGDFATLAAAYLAAGVAQGAPLMASFEGGITERPRADGDGAETTVVVESFTGVWPEETCEKATSAAALTNTYWKVVRLGKTEIKAGDGDAEPRLILREGETRFVATLGCNQMMGDFTRDGDRLSFGAVASTRMACPPTLDAWEQSMAATLAATTSWRVNGEALELLDASGMQIALFQAVPPP